MIILKIKSGERVGNVIIYSGELRCDKNTKWKQVHVFLVETDYGNKMLLTWREVNELFEISHVASYGVWRADRDSLRNFIDPEIERCQPNTPPDYAGLVKKNNA